jgi:hypothetical protein
MNRHTRHLLAGVIIGAALLTTGATQVSACSCVGPIVACETAWTTDGIFVGKVLSVGRVAGTGDPRWLRRLVRFDVREAFKGVQPGEIEVVTGAGGGDCGYDFREGRTYLVYAHRNPATGQLGAGICSRTAPVEQAGEDLEYLRGPFVQPSELGRIRGQVTRHDPPLNINQPARRAPFAGAEIRLEGYARTYTTTSADDGSYEFRVPVGEYRLFTTVREGVYAMPGSEGRTVWLRDTRGCGAMDIAVRADGRIAGRLLDGAGRPVPFMSVELVTARQLQSTSLSATTRTLTDARGHFEFTQLDAGTYATGLTLRRNKRDGVDTAVWISRDGTATAGMTDVEPEGRVDVGDLRLPSDVSTITLSGVVVTAEGRPVSGAQVRFLDPGPAMGTIGAPVTTAEDGRFSLSVIAGRSYQLVAEWFSPTLAPRRFVTARSESFEAAGELKPFRLVLSEAR